MTDTQTETRETLWITDAELIRRIGAPEKIAREALHMLDRDRSSGFPKPNPLAGGCALRAAAAPEDDASAELRGLAMWELQRFEQILRGHD